MEKSVPGTRGPLPGTGVTPSAWNTCARSIWGVKEHMPPVGLALGSRSRIVAFHASLTPGFWTLRPNCPNCPRLIVAGPVFVSTRLGREVCPIEIETLALDVRVGVFQVTSAVFVSVVPAGSPAAICTRKRTSMDCPGGNGPFTTEYFAVRSEPAMVTPDADPFIVGAGLTNVRRPSPALLRSSVITTEVAGFGERLVTCTR